MALPEVEETSHFRFRVLFRCDHLCEQDFSPTGRGQSPWCESDRGSTVQTGGGLYRQIEVITMGTFIALLGGAVAVVLVFLGIIIVVGVAWFIQTLL